MAGSKARVGAGAGGIKKTKLANNNKLGLREFSKIKNTGLSLRDIQSLRSLNTKVSSFGSPHDDIFKRISNRIELLCRTDRILDCKK